MCAFQQSEPGYYIDTKKMMDIDNWEKQDFLSHLGASAETIAYKKSNELYCVKAFKDPFNADQYESLFKEISLLSQTNYPAVLSLIGYHPWSNILKRPIIITKYYPHSLDTYIKNNPFGIEPTKKYIIILGIAQGMKYLHSIGITHRDLKPGNILIDDNGYPVICDLGQSRYALPKMETSSVGTSYYKAPELKNSHYSMKIDVYSFAIVFYEIFTWGPAFSSQKYKNSASLYSQIVNGKRPDTEVFMNDTLKNFANDCWDNDPLVRPSFNAIVDLIKQKDFMDAMDANKREVDIYLSFLKDSLTSEQKDLSSIKALADQNNVEKMVEYADILFTGENLHKVDIKGASEYYKKAANMNNSYAMKQLAYIILMKNDQSQIKEAEDYLISAIRLGNYEALKLFNEYEFDKKVAKREMVEFLKICADPSKKNQDAMYEYANVLYEGKYVNQDKEAALFYFKEAANLGNLPSISRAARMMQEGDGVKVNKFEAGKYFNIGIQKEDANSMLFYAVALINDTYAKVGTSNSNIVKYLHNAADIGNVNSMLFYAIILQSGYFNTNVDKNEAKSYFDKAKNANSEEAAKLSFYFASLIQSGQMNFFQPNDAIHFLRNAAQFDIIEAKLAYVKCLPKGCQEALNILRKAASLGSEEAREMYCNLYGPFHKFFYATEKNRKKHDIDITLAIISNILTLCSHKDKWINALKAKNIESIDGVISYIKSAVKFVYVRKPGDDQKIKNLNYDAIKQKLSTILDDSDFI